MMLFVMVQALLVMVDILLVIAEVLLVMVDVLLVIAEVLLVMVGALLVVIEVQPKLLQKDNGTLSSILTINFNML